ncbi:MAG: hypothetical protein HZA90_10350 [Verrucomicrobia bacterium]|nr:hypothetical protein [Verrucomicrobiota bacterium]
MNTEKPYERQANESAKAFEAFTTYANQGATRSLVAVGQALGKSGSLIERWSRRYQWVERAWTYDARMARVKHEAEEAQMRAESAEWKRREKEQREKEWRVSNACIQAGEEALKRFYENARRGATLGDVSRIFEVGSKLGRLATGLATERTELTGEHGGPIQVDLLPTLRKVFGEIVDLRDGLGARPPGDDRQILLLPRGDCTATPSAATPAKPVGDTQPKNTP